MVKEIPSSYPVLSILIFWQNIAYLFIYFVCLFIFYNIYLFDIFFIKAKHCQKVILFGCHFDSVTFFFTSVTMEP